MTEQDRLMARLFDNSDFKLRNFHVTRGHGPCTKEELCAEINSALDQGIDGSAPRSKSFDDDCLETDVRTLFGTHDVTTKNPKDRP